MEEAYKITLKPEKIYETAAATVAAAQLICVWGTGARGMQENKALITANLRTIADWVAEVPVLAEHRFLKPIIQAIESISDISDLAAVSEKLEKVVIPRDPVSLTAASNPFAKAPKP
jgi:hypothetical protein